jgi:hypothetical protein
MNLYHLGQRHGLRALLIAAIVACALWIGYAVRWGERAPPAGLQPVDQAVRLEEIRLAPAYPMPGPVQDLSETTARPLFAASRRPLPVAAQSGSPGSSALPRGRYMLTGVSISPGKRVALLRDATTNKSIRVEQNKEVGGILVESVTPTKVVLKLGAEREELALSVALAPKAAALTPPKPDQAASSGQAATGAPPALNPPLAPTPPAAAALPGMPRAAADIANADPITEADVAERAARVAARRSRQSASEERAPR